MEHFDITASFSHESFTYNQTVYVREMRQSEGSYNHCKTFGIMKVNMLDGKSAENYFLKRLI